MRAQREESASGQFRGSVRSPTRLQFDRTVPSWHYGWRLLQWLFDNDRAEAAHGRADGENGFGEQPFDFAGHRQVRMVLERQKMICRDDEKILAAKQFGQFRQDVFPPVKSQKTSTGIFVVVRVALHVRPDAFSKKQFYPVFQFGHVGHRDNSCPTRFQNPAKIPDEAHRIEVEMLHCFPARDEVELICRDRHLTMAERSRAKVFKQIAGLESDVVSLIERFQRVNCRIIPFKDLNLVALPFQDKGRIAKKRTDFENAFSPHFPKVEMRCGLP
ncbi:MAG: hypothetical protein WCS42_14415 [Verrucomicrobiota bacterium]